MSKKFKLEYQIGCVVLNFVTLIFDFLKTAYISETSAAIPNFFIIFLDCWTPNSHNTQYEAIDITFKSGWFTSLNIIVFFIDKKIQFQISYPHLFTFTRIGLKTVSFDWKLKFLSTNINYG